MARYPPSFDSLLFDKSALSEVSLLYIINYSPDDYYREIINYMMGKLLDIQVCPSSSINSW